MFNIDGDQVELLHACVGECYSSRSAGGRSPGDPQCIPNWAPKNMGYQLLEPEKWDPKFGTQLGIHIRTPTQARVWHQLKVPKSDINVGPKLDPKRIPSGRQIGLK